MSNDELLEILSETRDPLRVQPFLKKCFEGIKELEFADADNPKSAKYLDITAMQSVEGEKVVFTSTTNPRDAEGNVEKWLIQVEIMMRETLKVRAIEATKHYTEIPRIDWILCHPGMLVLSVSQVCMHV